MEDIIPCDAPGYPFKCKKCDYLYKQLPCELVAMEKRTNCTVCEKQHPKSEKCKNYEYNHSGICRPCNLDTSNWKCPFCDSYEDYRDCEGCKDIIGGKCSYCNATVDTQCFCCNKHICIESATIITDRNPLLWQIKKKPPLRDIRLHTQTYPDSVVIRKALVCNVCIKIVKNSKTIEQAKKVYAEYKSSHP